MRPLSRRLNSPVNTPTIASPVNCCHQDSVWRSHITRSELRRLPVVPNVSSRPSTRRSKTSDELHRGQNVTAIGCPPKSSLTTSCHAGVPTGELAYLGILLHGPRRTVGKLTGTLPLRR